MDFYENLKKEILANPMAEVFSENKIIHIIPEYITFFEEEKSTEIQYQYGTLAGVDEYGDNYYKYDFTYAICDEIENEEDGILWARGFIEDLAGFLEDDFLKEQASS